MEASLCLPFSIPLRHTLSAPISVITKRPWSNIGPSGPNKLCHCPTEDLSSSGPDGKLAEHIVEAFREYGFYIFKGVVSADELDDLERDVTDILDRAPIAPDAKVDRHGNPAIAHDCEGRSFRLVKPLSDPLGGSKANFGRHQIKMDEPEIPEGAPDWVVQVLLGPLQHSDAHLRYYGHPGLLTIVAGVKRRRLYPV